MTASDVTATLRFFAAARAAVGLDELVVEAPAALGDMLGGLAPAAGGDVDELAAVLGRSSFLVDGVTTRDRELVVPAGAVVDVMPPFAGG